MKKCSLTKTFSSSSHFHSHSIFLISHPALSFFISVAAVSRRVQTPLGTTTTCMYRLLAACRVRAIIHRIYEPHRTRTRVCAISRNLAREYQRGSRSKFRRGRLRAYSVWRSACFSGTLRKVSRRLLALIASREIAYTGGRHARGNLEFLIDSGISVDTILKKI